MSTSANGASDALGMGPSAGYILIFVIIAFCVLTVSIYMSCLHAVAFVSDIHTYIYVVTNLVMLYFLIKLTMKMPNYLTYSLSKLSCSCRLLIVDVTVSTLHATLANILRSLLNAF